MADVTSRVETVSNAGATIATLGDNFLKHTINQADVGRELIVKFAKTAMTNADVTAYRNAITLAGGVAGALPADTGDAFTVAAIGTANGAAFVSGTTAVLFMRVQGTGTFNTTDAAAGVGGTTVTVEAVFTPAL
jgi:hypothetical protein